NANAPSPPPSPTRGEGAKPGETSALALPLKALKGRESVRRAGQRFSHSNSSSPRLFFCDLSFLFALFALGFSVFASPLNLKRSPHGGPSRAVACPGCAARHRTPASGSSRRRSRQASRQTPRCPSHAASLRPPRW